jgi:flagellar hook protein FlgE
MAVSAAYFVGGTLDSLATEFGKLIATQRGFQASSRTVKVTDTVLEEVSNLKH